MNNTDLLLVLIGLGVLLVIGTIFVIYTVKKSGNKQEANDFLEGLADELKKLILKIIKSFSVEDLENLTEENIAKIETDILKQIYDTCWNYITCIVEKNLDKNQDFFTQAVLALLQNKEFIEEFIRKLINSENITQIIHSKATVLSEENIERKLEVVEKEDKDLQEEFSDQEKYIEELTDNDQTHGEDISEPTEEELSKLNPQVDEPEDLDPENDISVEVVNDDIYYDKSGRARSKKTGKWVKVNK